MMGESYEMDVRAPEKISLLSHQTPLAFFIPLMFAFCAKLCSPCLSFVVIRCRLIFGIYLILVLVSKTNMTSSILISPFILTLLDRGLCGFQSLTMIPTIIDRVEWCDILFTSNPSKDRVSPGLPHDRTSECRFHQALCHYQCHCMYLLSLIF